MIRHWLAEFAVKRGTAMITRARFLKTRNGGYLHREVPEEDAALTPVDPEELVVEQYRARH